MRLAATSVLLLACGCGTALSFIKTHKIPHGLHARGPQQVEVFMAGRPTRPFVEIGLIESQQEAYSQDTPAGVIAEMRAFAGERGCDGLVIFAGNDRLAVPGTFEPEGNTLKGYRASCVVYTKASTVAQQPAATALPAPAHCLPNATQLCYGPGGCRGAQSCTAEGTAYTPCDCGQQPAAAATAAQLPAAN